MKDEIRAKLQTDIDTYRRKAEYYDSLRLREAAGMARRLADNIELALTTLPREGDTEIR
jgi:hypothetical protein